MNPTPSNQRPDPVTSPCFHCGTDEPRKPDQCLICLEVVCLYCQVEHGEEHEAWEAQQEEDRRAQEEGRPVPAADDDPAEPPYDPPS